MNLLPQMAINERERVEARELQPVGQEVSSVLHSDTKWYLRRHNTKKPSDLQFAYFTNLEQKKRVKLGDNDHEGGEEKQRERGKLHPDWTKGISTNMARSLLKSLKFRRAPYEKGGFFDGYKNQKDYRARYLKQKLETDKMTLHRPPSQNDIVRWMALKDAGQIDQQRTSFGGSLGKSAEKTQSMLEEKNSDSELRTSLVDKGNPSSTKWWFSTISKIAQFSQNLPQAWRHCILQIGDAISWVSRDKIFRSKRLHKVTPYP